MAGHAPERVPLYASRSKKRCLEFALVLDAVGIACEVLPWEDRFAVVVHVRDADAAREELRLYRREQWGLRSVGGDRLRVNDGLVTACLFGVTILSFDILQRNHAFSLDWWHAGMSQAALVRGGEWWRVFTALALHADTLHLAGNIVFGLIFGFLAGGVLGWGLALSGMLLAGALGNFLDSVIRVPEHTSIGASTAVFAAIGILAAYAWTRRQRRINRWVPLGGGVALLAFLGMSGESTNVVAHVLGFGAGCLFGIVFGALELRGLLVPWHKNGLAVAALVLFAVAWTLALLAHG